MNPYRLRILAVLILFTVIMGFTAFNSLRAFLTENYDGKSFGSNLRGLFISASIFVLLLYWTVTYYNGTVLD